MDFGIAAEGVTDQVTIQNVLCGYFRNVEDLEQEITFVQPHEDATDSDGYGSWTNLFSYLSDVRFRQDVLNIEFLIIQVDTDVCQEKGFDVSITNEKNKEISVSELVNRIIERLIEQIGKGDPEFYNKYKEKIIFAVCVHSLECWIYKYYETNGQKINRDKTKNCTSSLERIISQNNKKLSTLKCGKEYENLTKPFRKIRTIDLISKNDSSFELFIKYLERIDYPI